MYREIVIPIEIISVIFSFIEKKHCYRCNKYLLPTTKYIKCYGKIFCSNNCIEYQH